MVKNLIESRRSSNITNKQKKREPQGERVSIMVAAHYSDIYTFDPAKVRWDGETGVWIYYEGYGRKCQEKRDFVGSINGDHELWEIHKDPVTSVTPAEIIPCSAAVGPSDPKKVRFGSLVQKRLVETSRRGESTRDTNHTLDGSDRADRGSVNFQQMLSDYVEKARSKELKEGFFEVGGMGRKWGENTDFVDYFFEKFSEIDEYLNGDKKRKISLSDQGVKDYPVSHYRGVRDRFFLYNWTRINSEKDSVSSLRATAPVFVPVWSSVVLAPLRAIIDGPRAVVIVPGLQRCAPPKICGVYRVDSPARGPSGPPPPRRPSASTKNSTRHLTWEQKEEQERDYEDLSNKLDKIATLQ
tara:strand:+ start:54 stop:1118 length:1065 start_codon:yes stop_codon:yes gene_type:complete